MSLRLSFRSFSTGLPGSVRGSVPDPPEQFSNGGRKTHQSVVRRPSPFPAKPCQHSPLSTNPATESGRAPGPATNSLTGEAEIRLACWFLALHGLRLAIDGTGDMGLPALGVDGAPVGVAVDGQCVVHAGMGSLKSHQGPFLRVPTDTDQHVSEG